MAAGRLVRFVTSRWPNPRNPRLSVSVVFVAGMFMTIMDSTVVNVALPTLSRQFGVSTAAVSAVVTSYLVAVAVVMPASGWLGDRVGGKRLLLGALALFTAASAACGLAGSLPGGRLPRRPGRGRRFADPGRHDHAVPHVPPGRTHPGHPPADGARAAGPGARPGARRRDRGRPVLAVDLLRQRAGGRGRAHLRRRLPAAAPRARGLAGSTCPAWCWWASASRW